MNLHVGTSGYSYKEWKGSFYPEDLPAKDMLKYYAGRFQTVEINNTFYRIPKTSVVEAWAAEVPDGFKFVLKASQRITHFKRLKDAGEPLSFMLRAAEGLADHLGPMLFQLPPNLKKDLPRLKDFVGLLPRGFRAAFEFRHQSWFEDDTFDLLRGANLCFCIAEAENDLKTPFESTADWGYIRLRMVEYTKPELRTWLKNIRAQKWGETFVFFKHEDAGKGPKMAQVLLDLNTDG
jgi:uncharacterized protein YecE (DUF72 family)